MKNKVTKTEMNNNMGVDYEQIKIEAALRALQGFCSNPYPGVASIQLSTLVAWSVETACTFVKELKLKAMEE